MSQDMGQFSSARANVGWSERDLAVLRQLVGMELPMRFIASRLGRSEAGVRIQARQLALAAMGCEGLGASFPRYGRPIWRWFGRRATAPANLS
ncbi:MAG TPA: hypothetical protein VGD23_13200 [Sphingomicrobium sp.]